MFKNGLQARRLDNSLVQMAMTKLRRIPSLLGRGWLVAWVLVVPLIHIHPEVDHAHGAPDHVHGGLYHSVLSKDLSCEFHGHSHSASPTSDHSHHSTLMTSSHFSGHLLNHDEIAFSLLNKRGDTPVVSPEESHSLLGSDPLRIAFIHSITQLTFSRGSPPTCLFLAQHSIRPPPFLPF